MSTPDPPDRPDPPDGLPRPRRAGTGPIRPISQIRRIRPIDSRGLPERESSLLERNVFHEIQRYGGRTKDQNPLASTTATGFLRTVLPSLKGSLIQSRPESDSTAHPVTGNPSLVQSV